MVYGKPVLGHYEYTLDKKNRLFIPAKHREALGGELIIGPSFKDDSLTVFSQDDFNDICVKVEENFDEDEKYAMEEEFFTKCDTYSPDDQGRITLNATHVDMGGLAGTVIIEGVGHRAKIWASDRYANKGASAPKKTLRELADKGKL